LLKVLHGCLFIWAPDKIHIFLCQNDLTHFAKSLAHIWTILHTPRHLEPEKIAVQPVQNLLNLVIIGVMSFESTVMAHSHNFQPTDIHLPTQKGVTSFLDMLKDSIYVVKVFPNKLWLPVFSGMILKCKPSKLRAQGKGVNLGRGSANAV